MTHIGIDPGKNTGVAVWDGTQFTYVDTFDFWGAYDYVMQYRQETVSIYIEVPRTKVNWHKSKSDITSANVGGVYREANLLADGLERKGFKVTKQHPQGKKTAAQVQRLTGYTGRTNSHTRDAMLLVYAR